MFLKLTGANKTSQGLDKVSKSTKQLDQCKNSEKKMNNLLAGMSGLGKGAIVECITSCNKIYIRIF